MKNIIKSKKKPNFIRQKATKFKRLEKKWRKPKGRHSKMRRYMGGHRNMPSIGYGTSKKIRKELTEIMVSSLKDLENIKENTKILLSSRLGKRKRIELLNKVKKLKLKIANIKNIDDYITKIQERVTKRKEEKRVQEESKKKKKEEAIEKKKEVESKETKKAKEKEEEEKKKILLKGEK